MRLKLNKTMKKDRSHTPVTGQDTCKVPAYPCHLPGYLQATCTPLSPARIHWPGYLQGTCIPLSLARTLQATCIPLSLVRIPTEYLHTPVTGKDRKEDTCYSELSCLFRIDIKMSPHSGSNKNIETRISRILLDQTVVFDDDEDDDDEQMISHSTQESISI